MSCKMSLRRKAELEWQFKKNQMCPHEIDQFVVDMMIDLYYNRIANSKTKAAKQRAQNVALKNDLS